MTNKNKSQVTLLIDADNISPQWAKTIMQIAESYGTVVFRYICGTKKHLQGWSNAIEEHKFEQEEAPTGKNSTDKLIVAKATHIAASYDKTAVFCFATHDKHFAIAAQLVKQWGNRVISIGKKHTAKSLKNACEFVELKPIKKTSPQVKKVKAIPQVQKSSKLKKVDELLQLLKKAFVHAGQEWLELAKLGNILKKVDATFKAKDYGSAKLSKLLKMSEFVELSPDGKQVKLKASTI